MWNRRQVLGRSAAAAALAHLPLEAQDVGLGARRGPSKRLETPYSLEIETPHVKWANPLPGGPIRLLAVPTVNEGRTVIELAQRLSLDLTTVSIDPAWDVNKWTMSFGRDYGARAERGNLSLIYSYLEQELTSEVRGLDIISGIPRRATITSEEIREALREPVTAVIGCVKGVIEQCHPELVADLVDNGIVLTGGGALLRGLDLLMSEQLGVPVRVAEDPLTTVARGTAICLEHLNEWKASLETAD